MDVEELIWFLCDDRLLSMCITHLYLASLTICEKVIQTKVVRSAKQISIAVQIRTNLRNHGTLKNVSIVMAIPPLILSSSIKIMSEEKYGSYDDLKRIIKWNKRELAGGQSLMLLAQAEIADNTVLLNDELPKFPILVRCLSSQDTVSKIDVDAKPLDGYNMKLTVNKICSFRLLHRLPQ